MNFGPEHEFPHRPGTDPLWRESYYFNFFNPETGLGGIATIGIMPNQAKAEALLCLYRGGSRVLLFKDEAPVMGNPETIAVGPLVFERAEPQKRWRIRFQGQAADFENIADLGQADRARRLESVARPELELDLTFVGENPVFDYHTSTRARPVKFPRPRLDWMTRLPAHLRELRLIWAQARGMRDSSHYEQAGSWSGTLRLAGRAETFSGRGCRDHSWGIRDWAAPRAWIWLSGQFGPELFFNCIAVEFWLGRATAGYVFRDGKNHPLRGLQIETRFAEDGRLPKSLRVRMAPAGSERLDISGELLTVIPLPKETPGRSTLIAEGRCQWLWQGRVGYGVAEYLHQVR